MRAPEYVIVGRVRKPHGVRGELVVDPITDTPAEVFAAGQRLVAGTTEGDVMPGAPEVVVQRSRPRGDALLVFLEGVSARTDAEPWRGRFLLLPMSAVAPPGPGEAFLHELLGMDAVAEDGVPLGRVSDLLEVPSGALLELEHAGGRALVPVRAEFVRAINRDARRITLSLPDGLLD
ncbi:MAG TPA: ribosome maturation factor RimM [Gemmatimonadaceae bacterium]|nr:ribosome maturation factor RimM [Gemmatimonadaceae bacterium]